MPTDPREVRDAKGKPLAVGDVVIHGTRGGGTVRGFDSDGDPIVELSTGVFRSYSPSSVLTRLASGGSPVEEVEPTGGEREARAEALRLVGRWEEANARDTLEASNESAARLEHDYDAAAAFMVHNARTLLATPPDTEGEVVGPLVDVMSVDRPFVHAHGFDGAIEIIQQLVAASLAAYMGENEPADSDEYRDLLDRATRIVRRTGATEGGS